jgi:hypothetical protein
MQIVGDSFPDVDRKPTPPSLTIGMGQWAKYMYVQPEENLTVRRARAAGGSAIRCPSPLSVLKAAHDHSC